MRDHLIMDFASFRLTDDEHVELLATQTECTIGWLNADGWPVSAVHTDVFEREAFWVTSFRDRPRVACLFAEPRSTVAVSSAGTSLGPDRMVRARTSAIVHDDTSTREWFYPRFCNIAAPSDDVAAGMARALARQDRVIIEFRPQSWNSFNGVRMRSG